MTLREQAHAKVNLVLHVGRPRDGGLHPLCSLFASIDLADELEGAPAARGADTVECPGVQGENLALAAIHAFRDRTGLPAEPVELRILKRIPVAAGLGGGSADAAATLRLLNRMTGARLGKPGLRELAAGLGSDVPSQIEPGHALVRGTGEIVEPVSLPALPIVLVPQAEGLATAAVYAEHDRLGGGREKLDPGPLRALAARAAASRLAARAAGPRLASAPRLAAGFATPLAAGLENDLQPAALSLRPELAATLERLRAAGALGAALSGSGPTCFGLFADTAGAEQAAAAIPGALPTRLRPA